MECILPNYWSQNWIQGFNSKDPRFQFKYCKTIMEPLRCQHLKFQTDFSHAGNSFDF